MGCRMQEKLYRYLVIFCRLSTMHKCDRETDKQTDHGTVTSIPIGEMLVSDVA